MTTPIQSVGRAGVGIPIQGPGSAYGPGQTPFGGPAGSFKDTLAGMLGDVQGLQDEAGDTVGAFLRGDPVELHDVMAAVEEAGIALEMLIEVRNRLTEAYRTVVNMQT